jgi:hypothetical protein
VIFQFEIATQTRQRGSADLGVLPAPLPAVESNLSAFPVNFAINAMNSLRIYQYLLSNSKKKKGASLSYAAVCRQVVTLLYLFLLAREGARYMQCLKGSFQGCEYTVHSVRMKVMSVACAQIP